MPYLIDGHNLIGCLPDIHLDDPEDEVLLIRKLSDYFKRKGISGTVYFDKRGPGMERERSYGRVKVEFATSPNTADSAIRRRLRQHKKSASNYIVVSSDHQVQESARRAGARIMDSSEFAHQLGGSPPNSEENEKPHAPLSPQDVKQWQNLFENHQNEG
jgi:predicted RNA-binding protein with PIN domain